MNTVELDSQVLLFARQVQEAKNAISQADRGSLRQQIKSQAYLVGEQRDLTVAARLAANLLAL